MHKDAKKLGRELVAQGFEVHTTTRGHLTVRREGQIVAVLPGTPGDWQSHRNGLARLRRVGFTSNHST